jgi:hypothetical protein
MSRKYRNYSHNMVIDARLIPKAIRMRKLIDQASRVTKKEKRKELLIAITKHFNHLVHPTKILQAIRDLSACFNDYPYLIIKLIKKQRRAIENQIYSRYLYEVENIIYTLPYHLVPEALFHLQKTEKLDRERLLRITSSCHSLAPILTKMANTKRVRSKKLQNLFEVTRMMSSLSLFVYMCYQPSKHLSKIPRATIGLIITFAQPNISCLIRPTETESINQPADRMMLFSCLKATPIDVNLHQRKIAVIASIANTKKLKKEKEKEKEKVKGQQKTPSFKNASTQTTGFYGTKMVNENKENIGRTKKKAQRYSRKSIIKI